MTRDSIGCATVASTTSALAPGATFSGSYVAPMALLNAIVLTCAEIAPSRALALLRQTEKEYLSGPRWYEEAPGRNDDKPHDGRILQRKK